MLVSCHEVRCREDLNMTINMCVCVDRDGVQMILDMFTTLGLPANRTKTVELELEAVHSSL